MKNIFFSGKIAIILSGLALIFSLGCKPEKQLPQKKYKYAMVIHGGAGTIKRKNMSPEAEAHYRAALDTALDIGQEIMEGGGAAMDAVEQVIRYLEDCPLFNAGRGAVFTHNGKNELDASIMRGDNLQAGAVAAVSQIKHPISAARAVMSASPHVLLGGSGAEEFAKEQGLEMVDPSYFYTQKRWDALQRSIKKREKSTKDKKHGTVGCVALDKDGNIVAGTSTGGMTNKRYGRIGDSPIIGAGNYADNKTCGISCTGHGEYFIRHAVAYQVAAQMQYGSKSLKEAANHVIHKVLAEDGGRGGLIGLDRDGNIAMPFNTLGMYRGYVRDGERYIGIYKNE